MGAAAATTLFDLPEGRTKLDRLFLHGPGHELFANLEATATECFQLVSRLLRRKDVNQDQVVERSAPLNDLLSNSQVLRDNLVSVDARLRQAASESASLRGWNELQEHLFLAQKKSDQTAVDRYRCELRARYGRIRQEQYRMLPDMKASLRYRLLLLRRWRAMLNLQIGLYELSIDALKRSIEKLTGGGASGDGSWVRETLPPDDSIPEFPDEIRALIIAESKQLEEILRRKEELERLLRALEEAERFVSTELDNQVRRFAKEEVPAPEEAIQTRVFYRPENKQNR